MPVSEGSDARFLADLLEIARRRPEDLEYWMQATPGDWPMYHVPGSDPEMESIARRRRMRDVESNDAALREMMGGSYKTEGPRDLADLFPHARMTGYAPSKTAERVHSGMNVDVVDLGNGQYAVMSTEDAHAYHRLRARMQSKRAYRRDPKGYIRAFLERLREKGK
jgi:hypothetical protein